jgi:hypothetical protein
MKLLAFRGNVFSYSRSKNEPIKLGSKSTVLSADVFSFMYIQYARHNNEAFGQDGTLFLLFHLVEYLRL